ncbi:unnamed protein product [Arctia plantaginis]|uniref:Uncharacterized protein n=1 Tax=Arctia plantaginis TaxID=874455 RepID=A0A8S1BLD2_ARCPL|nr:unnamed protein product [Arctia plantaginis]
MPLPSTGPFRDFDGKLGIVKKPASGGGPSGSVLVREAGVGVGGAWCVVAEAGLGRGERARRRGGRQAERALAATAGPTAAVLAPSELAPTALLLTNYTRCDPTPTRQPPTSETCEVSIQV